jgi:hypothetical protein
VKTKARESWQTPSLQFEPASPQEMLQSPQLFESVLMALHVPPHSFWSAGQVVVPQAPFEHAPPGHTFPHAPQLFASFIRSTHDGAPASGAQKVCPGRQSDRQLPP